MPQFSNHMIGDTNIDLEDFREASGAHDETPKQQVLEACGAYKEEDSERVNLLKTGEAA